MFTALGIVFSCTFCILKHFMLVQWSLYKYKGNKSQQFSHLSFSAEIINSDRSKKLGIVCYAVKAIDELWQIYELHVINIQIMIYDILIVTFSCLALPCLVFFFNCFLQQNMSYMWSSLMKTLHVNHNDIHIYSLRYFRYFMSLLSYK